MKPLLLAPACLLFLLISCSDDTCLTCPEIPTAPALSYPIVGFWCAEMCEGQPMENGMSHGITLRRDGTYTECDSDTCSLTYHGTYCQSVDSLMLTPTNAPHPCCATWICEITLDSMIWRRQAADINPAWVFLRSTSN